MDQRENYDSARENGLISNVEKEDRLIINGLTSTKQMPTICNEKMAKQNSWGCP
jgi:hypothetical protein